MTSSRIFACAFALSCALSPAVARAQSADNKAQAQALFEDGKRLMAQGHYADACKKLEGSQKLDPGGGTLLNLAACYELNGQIASAWVTYKDAAVMSERHRDWVDQANEKAAELAPKLSHITIALKGDTPGFEIRRDGVVVMPATFGSPMPIDPGPHAIEARAQGYKTFTTSVTIGAAKDDQTVTIPALERGAEAAIGKLDRGAPQRVIGGIVTSVGGLGVVAGTVFGIIALGKKSDASAKCTPDFTTCNPEGKQLVDDAKSAGFISTVTLIGGGVFAAAGIVVILTAPRAETPPQPQPSALSARIGAPGAPLGFSFGGAF